MKLDIRSETRLSFEIDYGDQEWFLTAHGGDWFLDNPKKDGAWQNLGSLKRISWLSALTKALKEIGVS